MRLAAALAVCAFLAGCTEIPDASSERMVISIDDEGDGYAIGVPLWLADGGATAEQWLDHASVHSGQANLSIRQIPAGIALWIEGRGDATVNANDVRSTLTGAEPEAFLDGRHSLGTGPGGRALLIVDTGDVDVTWQYEGTSKDCALFLNHGWINATAGPSIALYGERPDPMWDCIR